jgi:serine protease Do
MEELIREGVVRRGTIFGITLQAMTTQIAQQLGAPDARGVLVTRVDSRSEAAQSGLRRGDVIVAFNATNIEGASQFLRLLGDAEIGSTATLTILRDGRRATVRVPIQEAQPTRRRGR